MPLSTTALRREHGVPARAVLTAAAALLVAGAGCSTTQPRTHEAIRTLSVCGTVLSRAAEVPKVQGLDPPHDDPQAPADSLLPPPYGHAPAPSEAQLRVVRIVSGCDHGGTVLVTPQNAVRTGTVVRAPDGSIIALVLIKLDSTTVTVHAYRGAVPLGCIQI
ncbi:hypothetical protein [Streptomyces sp. NPDC050485]|uniref:hypothetical protein n=1 Tax=Streptomyces sp. NPDC050485 TaxID=3365617 RepID=UPI0037937217